MWFWVMAQAKEGAAAEVITAKRKQWVSQGKDQQLTRLCRTAQRYVVAGSSPAQVFWLLETENPNALQLITEHFGELWTIDAHPVIPQSLAEVAGREGG